MMKAVIIKYNAGNIRSVDFALRRLSVDAMITDDFAAIRNADRVIFPGVGEANNTMRYLRDRGLDRIIAELKQPVLAICLGQQLLCSWSEEGDTECIGVFKQNVKRFPEGEKIPHMGWNSIDSVRGDFFGQDLVGKYLYFVHSYYVPVCEDTSAISNYIVPFSAALQKDNFYTTQFHPEKSGDTGHQILKKFIEL